MTCLTVFFFQVHNHLEYSKIQRNDLFDGVNNQKKEWCFYGVVLHRQTSHLLCFSGT